MRAAQKSFNPNEHISLPSCFWLCVTHRASKVSASNILLFIAVGPTNNLYVFASEMLLREEVCFLIDAEGIALGRTLSN